MNYKLFKKNLEEKETQDYHIQAQTVQPLPPWKVSIESSRNLAVAVRDAVYNMINYRETISISPLFSASSSSAMHWGILSKGLTPFAIPFTFFIHAKDYGGIQ